LLHKISSSRGKNIKKRVVMKKFSFVSYYTHLLAITVLLLTCQVDSHDKLGEAYITKEELSEILDNNDVSYLYLGKEFSKLYDVISRIYSLEDNNAHSVIAELKEHIELGFSIGLQDAVLDALEYAERTLDANISKVSDEEAQEIAEDLAIVINQVVNDSLTINAKKVLPQIEMFEKDMDMDITRCGSVCSDNQGCALPRCCITPIKVVKVRAPLDVLEKARFRKNVEIDGKLKVYGKACFKEDVCFKDEVKFKDDVVFDEDVLIKGDLTVDGTVTFNGPIEGLTIIDVVIETLSATDIFVENLSAVEATIQTLTVTDLVVLSCMDSLCVNNLSAVDANIDELSSTDAVIQNLSVTDLTVLSCMDSLCVNNLSIGEIVISSCIDSLCVTNLSAVDATIGTLSATDAVIQNLSATDAAIQNLSVTDLTVLSCMDSLCVNNLSIGEVVISSCIDSLCVTNLSAVDASIDTLSATDIVADNITAINITVDNLSAADATIASLSATDAFINNLSVTDLVVISCIDDLCVTNLSVTDIFAGSLSLCDVIVSCDIFMNNTSGPAIGNIMKAGNRFIHNAGTDNTFVGINAGNFTMAGAENVGVGRNALFSNTTGFNDNAVGAFSMNTNTIGNNNAAYGSYSLVNNIQGNENTAIGNYTLVTNTTGIGNTAVGFQAGYNLTVGNNNTFVGNNAALALTTGFTNIAIGYNTGLSLTTGNDNIYIANPGVATENGAIRIGTPATHTATFIQGIFGTAVQNTGIEVFCDANGQLGTVVSSERFKHDIQDMSDISENIYELQPVEFIYNGDETNTIQYGLIAEQVDQVFPQLVVYDEEGKPYTVRYHLLPQLLLNELQKLNAIVRDQAVTISELKMNNIMLNEAMNNVMDRLSQLNV
jgi:hypothetical protein